MGDEVIEFVKVTAATASASSRVLTVQAAGVGAEGDDNGAQSFDDVEVTQPCGLMARPALTSTTEAVAVRRGDELVALVIVDKGAPAQDVEAGETRLYGVNGSTNGAAVIRIRATGAIEVTAKSGTNVSISVSGGGNVVLAGGSLSVARQTDAVSPHANMTTWMTQVALAVNGLVPGAVAPALPVNFATIAAGAANVKA